MTDTSNVPLAALVTDDELLLIGRASALLEALSDRCTTAAWNAGSTWRHAPRAQDIGRLAGVANVAADALFTVANIAHNYVGVPDAVDTFNKGVAAYRAEPNGDRTDTHPGWSVKA